MALPPPAPVVRSGEIDAGYGTGGFVRIAASEGFREMAVGQDGSVFVTGNSVLKLSPAGSVALDYGQAGRVAMPAASPVVDEGGSLHVMSGMQVVKLDPSGRLDPSFGSGGRVALGPGVTPLARLDRIARDRQGNLYVAGVTGNFIAASGNLYAAGYRRGGLICIQGAVAKLDAGGNAIAEFGFGGYVALDEINDIQSMGMDAAGRIYLGGTHFTTCSALERPFVVTRLGG
jgi:hypothetical protein